MTSEPDKPTLRVPPPHWDEIRHAPLPPGARAWEFGALSVVSECSAMEAPDGSGDVIPQWLISVSRHGRRPSDKDVARALRAFGMEDAEEDNHHPGVARHFFLVVDPTRRVDCECKVDDVVVKEPDGYKWSNDPKDCRGCALARLVPGYAVCRVHGVSAP